MGKAKPKGLNARWTRAVVGEVSALLAGRDLTPAVASPPLGTIEVGGQDYLDLRGFPFAERLMDVALDRVDFSGCAFTGSAGFAGVAATGCRLAGCRIEGAISGTFRDCRFDDCAFDHPLGFPGTRFVRCAFDGAAFRGGDLNGAGFEGCSFRGCKMPRTEFLGCRFDGCEFTGAAFRNGSVGGAIFTRPRNNFRYVDPYDVRQKHEFVAGPDLPWVDLDETSTVGTVFRTE